MKFISITVVEIKLLTSFPQHEMLFLRENGSHDVYALPPSDVSYQYPPAIPWHWPWFCVDHAYCCLTNSCLKFPVTLWVIFNPPIPDGFSHTHSRWISTAPFQVDLCSIKLSGNILVDTLCFHGDSKYSPVGNKD